MVVIRLHPVKATTSIMRQHLGWPAYTRILVCKFVLELFTGGVELSHASFGM